MLTTIQFQLETHRESAETIPLEDLQSRPKPSAFPTKSIKKSKPSKMVISQTVVYKEKEKPPTAKRESPQEKQNTHQKDATDTSPTQDEETAESGQEILPASGEGTQKNVHVSEQRVGEEPVVKINKITDDVTSKSEEGGKTGKEKKMEKEENREEKQQKEEEKKIEAPKGRSI